MSYDFCQLVVGIPRIKNSETSENSRLIHSSGLDYKVVFKQVLLHR
ncbi:hypothetical protein J2X69_000664 [Algoriphagus sp. 4150]|nr:hypothetical protein [Algoriphagus sp. 4150]